MALVYRERKDELILPFLETPEEVSECHIPESRLDPSCDSSFLQICIAGVPTFFDIFGGTVDHLFHSLCDELIVLFYYFAL